MAVSCRLQGTGPGAQAFGPPSWTFGRSRRAKQAGSLCSHPRGPQVLPRNLQPWRFWGRGLKAALSCSVVCHHPGEGCRVDAQEEVAAAEGKRKAVQSHLLW